MQKTIKVMMIKNTIKSEFTVITLENIEVLLIIFVIEDLCNKNTKRKSCSFS